MLEVLLLIFLCRKKMGPMMRAKGRNPFGYQFLLVALWAGGELSGIISGVLVSSDEEQWPVFVLTIIGAGLGCAVAFVIANAVSPIGTQRGFAVVPAMPVVPGPPGMPLAPAPPPAGMPPGMPPGGPPGYQRNQNYR
jgi:hypothetical protein